MPLTRVRPSFLFCCLAITIIVSPAVWAQNRSTFDLPAQPLAVSLRAVASQTGTNVLFDPPLVEGRVAPALKANLTLTQAFTKLLAGTGLQFRPLDDKTVTIVSTSIARSAPTTTQNASSGVSDEASSKEAGKKPSQDFRVAQVDQGAAGPQVVDDQNSEQKKQEGLTEIVVTGTNIRGVENNTAPVIVLDKTYIDSTGYTSTTQLIQSLPQNFGLGSQSAVQVPGTQAA